MKFFSFKNLAMTGALSAVGLGLIGVGAHAVFTQNTTSAQTINAGTLNVLLYSTDYLSGQGSTYLTLQPTAPESSTFNTGLQPIQVYNGSNIPATGISATFSNDGTGSGALFNELYVCVEDNAGNVIFNGSLASEFNGTATIPSLGPIAPGASEYYYVNYYAGNGQALGGNCGTSGAASLDNSVEGQAVTPTIAVVFNG
jgi:predicted ribosomally synthesized peptide with SipW-like signal peptide